MRHNSQLFNSIEDALDAYCVFRVAYIPQPAFHNPHFVTGGKGNPL